MRRAPVLAAIAAAFAFTTSASAQDVTGVWELSWESQRGAQTVVFTFAQDGAGRVASCHQEGLVSVVEKAGNLTPGCQRVREKVAAIPVPLHARAVVDDDSDRGPGVRTTPTRKCPLEGGTGQRQCRGEYNEASDDEQQDLPEAHSPDPFTLELFEEPKRAEIDRRDAPSADEMDQEWQERRQ